LAVELTAGEAEGNGGYTFSKAMNEDPLHRRIAETLVRPGEADPQLLALWNLCWPGGTADRVEPMAVQWIRRWQPEVLGAELPACTCRSGRCPICN
jgi:hypothetical protein